MNPEADLDLMRQVLGAGTEPSHQARRDARFALLDVIEAERRIGPTQRLRRRLRPNGARRLALLGAALLLGATGATAATVITIDSFGHDTPTQLFRDNPDRFGSPWVNQSLVPGTVRLVETIKVPGVGQAEYWTAAATHHGICVGLRLPGRVWAGSINRFQIGGPVPGCVYKFPANPTRAWSPKRGFFSFEYQVGGSWDGRIVIGTVPDVGSPMAVRDAFTGTTTRVVNGRYFAILIPPSRGQWGSSGEGTNRVLRLRYRLETLAASGRVLAKAPQTIEP
jgi:hypothetical protein